MRSSRLLALAAALAVAGVATAAVVTRNPFDYAEGTDVSTAFSGVRLTRVVNVPGIWVFAPTYERALIGRCTTYGVCPYLLEPLGTIGDNVYNVQQYRNCYNASRLGMMHADCNRPFAVLQATFRAPVDFVEFELTWLSDPPGLIAYNAAGDEIRTCISGVSTSGCVTSRVLDAGHEGLSTIRLASKTATISRVVVAGYIGTGRVTFMQYTQPAAP